MAKLQTHEIAPAIAKYGKPKAVPGVDCADSAKNPPGTICSTTDCVQGARLIQRCDQTKGCTEYEVIPC